MLAASHAHLACCAWQAHDACCSSWRAPFYDARVLHSLHACNPQASPGLLGGASSRQQPCKTKMQPAAPVRHISQGLPSPACMLEARSTCWVFVVSCHMSAWFAILCQPGQTCWGAQVPCQGPGSCCCFRWIVQTAGSTVTLMAQLAAVLPAGRQEDSACGIHTSAREKGKGGQWCHHNSACPGQWR